MNTFELLFEKYTKYLFVYNSPAHYPPELAELKNKYAEINASYCDASLISIERDHYLAAIQTVKSAWRKLKSEQICNGDPLLNEADSFLILKQFHWKRWLIGILCCWLIALIESAAFGFVIRGRLISWIFGHWIGLLSVITFMPFVVILVAVIIKGVRLRNKKAQLLPLLCTKADALYQQINQLAGENTPDLMYAFSIMTEQLNSIFEKETALERALVKSRLEDFYEFRLNNYNHVIEQLLLDSDIPAQLEDYNIRFINVSKNTAKNNNDDIQDYILYFQSVTA